MSNEYKKGYEIGERMCQRYTSHLGLKGAVMRITQILSEDNFFGDYAKGRRAALSDFIIENA